MTTISLRAYHREIEERIGQGRIDEAIAHSRHILKFFPKDIAAYRLLGKAYLESQRYTDAADIFQRVLAVIPDDFVSHVGMSIIREDESNMDAAIWHMERAFEGQPSNAAIQDELKRLYGKRDGMEPPKVRLTRGALARMYANGNLYHQAVSELRAALAEEQGRHDLNVLLAGMYHLDGQRVEAAEVCNAILRKLPFCLEANQILADILKESDRSEEATVYIERVQALDPYAAHLSPENPTREDVPDHLVTVSQLEWQPGQIEPEMPAQPSWATSLGIDMESDEPEMGVPDWLAGVGQVEMEEDLVSGDEGDMESGAEAEVEMGFEDEEEEELPDRFGETKILDEVDSQDLLEETEDVIPDWMKDAGWVAGSGEEAETDTLTTFEDEVDVAEISPGEVPTWLAEIAPDEGESVPEPAGDDEEMSGELPPWLDTKPPGPTDSVVVWLEKNKPEMEAQIAPEESEPERAEPEGAEAAEDDAIPTWLESLAGEITTGDLKRELADLAELGATPAEDEVPEWMSKLEPQEASVPEAADEPVTADDAPDWLQGDLEEEAVTDGMAEPEDEAIPDEMPVSMELEPDVPSGRDAAFDLDDEEAALSWLEDLATKDAMKEADQPVGFEERGEPAAEWMPESTEEETGVEFLEADEMVEERPVTAAQTAEPASEADLPEWLREMEAETPTPMQEASDDIPEWLKTLQGTPTEETPAAADSERAAPIGADLSDEDAALAWLESLAAKHGVDEEELVTKPEDRSEIPPDWVRDSLSGEEDVIQPEAADEPEEIDTVPSWMTETMVSPSFFDEEVDDGVPPFDTQDQDAVPDWMMETAISRSAEEQQLEEETEAWSLETLESGVDESGEGVLQPAAEELEDELPDWLQDTDLPEEAATVETDRIGIPEGEEEWMLESTLPEETAQDTYEPFEEALETLEAEPKVTYPLDEVSEVTDVEEAEALQDAAPEHFLETAPLERVDPLVTRELSDVEPVDEGVMEAPGTEVEPEAEWMLETAVPEAETAEPPPAVPEGAPAEALETLEAEPAPAISGPATDRYAEVLGAAQGALSGGQISEAVKNLKLLIRRGQHLDQVIDDLNESLYQYPVNTELWETLGDTYARANRLQEAIDAYTKAEELLR